MIQRYRLHAVTVGLFFSLQGYPYIPYQVELEGKTNLIWKCTVGSFFHSTLEQSFSRAGKCQTENAWKRVIRCQGYSGLLAIPLKMYNCDFLFFCSTIIASMQSYSIENMLIWRTHNSLENFAAPTGEKFSTTRPIFERSFQWANFRYSRM